LSQSVLSPYVKPLAEILPRLELTEPALGLKPEGTAEAFVDLLAAERLFIDAIHVLAHSLPKREAVTWGADCIQSAGMTAKPEPMAALEAARRWSAEPSEDNRRAAQKSAEAAKTDTPAGCLAMGAFFSQGNLAPPEAQVVIPPADDLTGRCVAGAVMIAGVIVQPESAEQRYAKFVEQGLKILKTKRSN
jgi:hypothetical protein